MKKILSKILPVLLAALMVCALCACTAPAITAPDGSDTVAGAAIKTALNVIETLAVTAVSVFGAWWAAKAKDKVQLQNINTAMVNLEAVVKQTVGELKQTVVDGMKEAAGNGKLTKEQVHDLKQRLVDLVLEKLDDPTKDMLTAAGADLCALITGIAESWISEQKVMGSFILPGGRGEDEA